jgi:hypothetical protein
MKVRQETLGLSSVTIAAGTYTSILPQLAHQPAETSPLVVIDNVPTKEPAKSPQRNKTGSRKKQKAWETPGQNG